MRLDKAVSGTSKLQQLFPGGDFAWAFRMRKADPLEFFAPQDDSGTLLQQKRDILDHHPERHLVESAASPAHLQALHACLTQWGANPGNSAQLESIARHIEADFILMDHDSQSLSAAAVCFPSSWNPAKWAGSSIHDIHAVVPQLNPQIGEMIRRFLTELKPGKAFQRANWSFTRSQDLNYHPAMERPALDADIHLEETFLRIEHQLFTAIEGAVVMGIRIQPIPLCSLAGDNSLSKSLARILETMPEKVARYKNLHRGRQRLIDLVSAP